MKNKKSAFTLIELMTVQICIMILAMIAWNNYHQYVYRAKTAEAFVVLGNMERQLRTYYYENGSFITTNPNPASAPGISAPGTQSAFGAQENWQALGMPVVPGEQVFFSYQVFAGQTETTSTNPVVNATLHAPTDDMDLVRAGLYTASNAPAALPTSYALHAKDFGLDFGIFNCAAMAGDFDQAGCMRACKEDQACIDKCKPPSDGGDIKDEGTGFSCSEQCRGDEKCIQACEGKGGSDTCIDRCNGDRRCIAACGDGDGKNPGHGQPGHNCHSSCSGNPPHGQPGHNCNGNDGGGENPGHGNPGHNCHSSCPGNPPHGNPGHHCNGNDDPDPDPEPTCEESCNGDQTCLRNSCGIGVGVDPVDPDDEEPTDGGGGNPGIQSCDPFSVSKPVDFGVRQNVGNYKWAIINAVGSVDPEDRKCSLKAKVIQVFDGDPKATGFISFDERD